MAVGWDNYVARSQENGVGVDLQCVRNPLEEYTLFGLGTEKFTDLQIKVAQSRRSESIISKVSEIAAENWKSHRSDCTDF